jgi:CRISP-associated protein Cas1
MDLIVETRGTRVSKHRMRLVVRKEDTRREFAVEDIEQIILGPGISITTDALLLAVEHGTDVVLSDWREDPKARLVSGGLLGAALTKRNQLAALDDERGVRIAWQVVRAKCRNQAHLLGRVNRSGRLAAVEEAVRRIRAVVRAAGVADLSGLDEMRPRIFAAEGAAGRLYISGFRQLLPEGLDFVRRTRRPPGDIVNAALSYGYGILHTQVQRGLFLVGLEPAAGFLHTDRWGRSSLTLDLMEPFRQPVVDRAVLTLARRGQLDPGRHAEPHGDGVYLSAGGRKLVAGQVFGRLGTTFTYRGQRVTWKQAIVLEARAVASYLLGHRSTYVAYVHRWS